MKKFNPYLNIIFIILIISLNLVLLFDRTKLKEKIYFADISIQNLKNNQKILRTFYKSYIDENYENSRIVADLFKEHLTENENSFSIFVSSNNCSSCVDKLILLIESYKNENHKFVLYVNKNDFFTIKLWKNKINNNVVHINSSNIDDFEEPIIIRTESKTYSFILYSPLIHEMAETFISMK